MKFWQKSFLGILAVFIIAINICLYLTSQYSFSLNLKRDTDRALGEYHSIISGIDLAMDSIYIREEITAVSSSSGSLMRSYADYYKVQSVYLQLSQSDKPLFSNIPVEAVSGIKSLSQKKDSYTIKIQQSGDTNYLYITGTLGGRFNDYSLTYVRDMTQLYSTHARLTRYLITVSALVEAILALILLFILRKLTNPIRTIQTAAGRIACGVYDERIHIGGRDEFHDLAENFNRMAESIQDKINELDKNAKDKQRLIDNLAHELRTPLTAIRGYAEYLQNATMTERNRRKATSYIISETDRIKNLSFKLLDLALLKNSRLDFEEIKPHDLLTQAKAAVETKLREKNIRLKINSSLDILCGDFILLQSLISNLLDNAANASPEGSLIELSAYRDAVPVIEVKDWGIGLDEEQIALICEPFYRVDTARSRSTGGIGLGLSLCSEIVRLHGAQMKIKSDLGKGTTIQVVFTALLQLSEDLLIPENV